MEIAQQAPAQIVDLAEFRLRRAVQARARSRVKRQFLWSWPATGQLYAAEFPLPAAATVRNLKAR